MTVPGMAADLKMFDNHMMWTWTEDYALEVLADLE